MTTPNSGKDKKAVLYLDLEGGYGGSSRSLYHFLRHLDRERFHPVVAVRKDGPALDWYRELRIPVAHVPEIPSFRPGERKQAVSYALYLRSRLKLGTAEARLLALKREHGADLLHVNHESLGLSGKTLAGRLGLPWICHIRVQLVPSVWARFLAAEICASAEALVCITEMNLAHLRALAWRRFDSSKAEVVRNIASPPNAGVEPLPEMTATRGDIKILSLSNFSPNRGVDRIIDVAEVLRAKGRRDIVFHLFGRPAHAKLIGGTSPYYETMIKRVQAQGLGNMVRFHGHTSQPERALAGADMLIKLSREDNPWGRDIMEGLAAGLPVITLGTYQGVVEHGLNGYLESAYDPERIADFITALAGDRKALKAMRELNSSKALRLFGGEANTRKLESIYERVLKRVPGA